MATAKFRSTFRRPTRGALNPLRSAVEHHARTVQEKQKFRLALAKFLDQLPDVFKKSPEVQFLEQEARVRIATLVQLKYQSSRYETATKSFEFSRAAMKVRWQAGYNDAKIALGEPRVFELPHVTEAARIFDVHHGWVM